jgi:hypothetical protein
MEKQYVESSNIESIGYDSSNSILEIEFKNGSAVWQYLGVPESLYYEFLQAGSKGKFFHQNILKQFPESRVG